MKKSVKPSVTVLPPAVAADISPFMQNCHPETMNKKFNIEFLLYTIQQQ